MSVIIRQQRIKLLAAAILVAAFLVLPRHAPAQSPAVSPVYPLDAQTIPWHKPAISVAVSGADIDPATIELRVDDQPVDFDYDPAAATISHTPSEYLATGAHSLHVSVENTQGQISELGWSFTVGTTITGALHSGGRLNVSGDAYIAGDTYSLGDTEISGSPTIAGNGYATGVIAWDGFSSPFLGMPHPNEPPRDFPVVDFNYYKSLAEAQGQAYFGKLHLTKKKPLSGVIFVDGDLKVSGGTHNITAVVTGEVKISDRATVSSFIDSMVIVAKEEIKVSGHPALSGVIYSETDEVEIRGEAALSGAIVAKTEVDVSGHMTAIDTLAPAPPVLDQPVSPTKQSTVNFTGDAEANSAVELIEGVQIIATDTADSTGRFAIPADLAEGAHNIIAVAIDTAGNVSEPSGAVPVVVDLTPPQIDIISPGPGASVSGTVTVEATATDNFGIDRVEFYIDDQLLSTATAEPYKVYWDTALLANQNYQLRAVALDGAGNSAESTVTVEVANNIITPLGGIFMSSDGLVVLNFPMGAVSEPVIIKYARLPDRTVRGFSQAANFFDLTAETFDGRPVNVFVQPFAMTITGVPAVENINLYFFNTEPARWQEVLGGVISNGMMTAFLDHLTEFALLADTEAPATTATLNTSEAPSGWHTAVTTITLDATDSGSGVATIDYQWDTTGGPWQTYGGPAAVPEGEHTLYYHSEDAAGNVEAEHSMQINIDTVPPEAAFSAPGEGTWLKGAATAHVTAVDIASGLRKVAFLIDDSPIGEATAAPYSIDFDTGEHADGPHQLHAVVADTAGNETTVSVGIKIDNTSPSVTSKIPGPDTTAAPGTIVSAGFSEDLNPLSIGMANTYLTNGRGEIVAASVDYDPAAAAAFLTPFTLLSEGETYTVNLGGDISDPAGNNLQPTSWRFSVPDITPPETSIQSPTGGVISGQSVTITGTAGDNLSLSAVELRIERASDGFYWDGAGWSSVGAWLPAALESGVTTQAFSYAWGLPHDDGQDSYVIEARAIDGSGLIDPTPATVSVDVDNIAPAVSFFTINNGAAELVSLDITIDSSVSGAVSMRVAEDPVSLALTAYVPYEPNGGYEFLTPDSTKTVYAQFKDAAGLESDIVQSTAVYKPQIGRESYFSLWSKSFAGNKLIVNLASGNLHIGQTDIEVAGRGISTKINRSYNSLENSSDLLGRGWRFNLEASLAESDQGIVYTDGDGTRHLFSSAGQGDYQAPAGTGLSLTNDTTWTLGDKNDLYDFKMFPAAGRAKLAVTTDDYGNKTTVTRNSSGTPTAINYPDDGAAVLNYTGARLTSIVDPLARRATYGYNGDGNLISFKGSTGRQIAYAYNDGLLSAVTDSAASIQLTYDALGRLKSIAEQRSTTEAPLLYAFEYFPGRTEVTAPSGKKPIYHYNAAGNPTRVIGGTGAVDYTWAENRPSGQSAGQNTLTFAHDALGNPSAFEFLMDGQQRGRIYTEYSGHRPARITDANNIVTTIARDTTAAAPHLETVTDSRGYSASIEYDAKGNVTRLVDLHSSAETYDADYGAVEYTYEPKGYLQKIAYPSGASVSFGYDAGDASWYVDGPGDQRTWFYLNDGAHSAHLDSRIAKVKSALGEEATYSYDGRGYLTGVKNGRGNVRSYAYDKAGHMQSETDPLGRAAQYSHDGDGLLTGVTYPVSQALFGYDEASRLKTARFIKNGEETSFALAYAPASNSIQTAEGPDGAYNFTYNQADWPTRVADPFGYIQTYEYLPGGQLKRISPSTGPNVDYVFQDNLMTALDSGVGPTSFAYDPRRNLTFTARPNGRNGRTVYDKANRPITTEDGPVNRVYQYDAAGNITTETINGLGTVYGYDALDRLTDWTDSRGVTQSYDYDASGNMTLKEEAEFSYDAADQLISDGINTYVYDNDGNLVDDGRNRYLWDGAGRLSAFGSNDGTTAYTYDYAGRRVTKTLPDGRTIRYHWQGNKLVAESDAAGLLASYAYTDRGRLHSMTRGGSTYYYHLSARGDVLALTDETGVQAAEYTYDPWGEVLSATGALADQPFRFAGYYFDDESGMYYLTARYYRPEIARFISPDPKAGDPGRPVTFNPYLYAFNNPLKYADPDGAAAVRAVGEGKAIWLPVNQAVLFGFRRSPRPAPSLMQSLNALIAGGSGYSLWPSEVIRDNGAVYASPVAESPGAALSSARELFGSFSDVDGWLILPDDSFFDSFADPFSGAVSSPGDGSISSGASASTMGYKSSGNGNQTFTELAAFLDLPDNGIDWGVKDSLEEIHVPFWRDDNDYIVESGEMIDIYYGLSHRGALEAQHGGWLYQWDGSCDFMTPEQHRNYTEMVKLLWELRAGTQSSQLHLYPYAAYGRIVIRDLLTGVDKYWSGGGLGNNAIGVSLDSGAYRSNHYASPYGLEYDPSFGAWIGGPRWTGASNTEWNDNGAYTRILRAIKSDTAVIPPWLMVRRMLGGNTPSGESPDPVNTAIGNFTYEHRDMKLPGKGPALELNRTYNSLDVNVGPLGRGWTHNFNVKLAQSDSSTTVTMPDGKDIKFFRNGETYKAAAGIEERLARSGWNSGWNHILTLPDQTQYFFDSTGKLLYIWDKFGNTLTLTYAANRLAGVADSAGRRLDFTYDADGRVSRVADSAGRFAAFVYDGNANLTDFTDTRGKTTAYAYDQSNQLSSITEPGANKPIVRNVYKYGRVKKQFDANGAVTDFYYNPRRRQTYMFDNKNNMIVHTHDGRGRLLGSATAETFNQMTYGTLDKPSTAISNGAMTTFGYDAAGNATSVKDPEGHTTLAAYNLTNNNILWSKDALSRQTTYGWDSTGKFLNSLTSPIGTTMFSYYADGLLKTLTDAEGHGTNFAYNTSGNLTKITDALDDSSTIEYNAAGHMIAATDGEGNKSEYSYDAGGNILSNTDPLAIVFPSERHKVDFTYDDRGNQTSFKDADSNLTRFAYDDMNSLTSVTDALSSLTAYGYDPNYNLVSVKDAEGHTTNYDYDANNRLKSINDATSNTVDYRYDPAGNLTKVMYPSGNESYFDYYRDSLLKSISYKSEETSYSFEYSAVHQINRVVDNAGKDWLFDYDEGDRLTTTAESINQELGEFSIGRAYDKASNLTELKAAGDGTAALGYNARYDLVGIDLPGGETTEVAFGYDRTGKRTSIKEPGVKSLIDFDEASRVRSWVNETSATSSRYDYDYDSNGNITLLRGSEATEAVSETRYAYDALNRLIGWYNPLIETTTTYSYDKVGNLLEVREGEAVDKSFSYNAANQISSPDYAYDAKGNMVEDPDKHYVYNAENRLKTVVSKSTSQTIASYAYDFMGRRINSTDASDSTTYFHYDGWNVVAESDSSGTITANYYYDTDGQITAMKKAGRTYYYQFNAHGDVVSLTDASGAIVNTYSYDPWGNLLSTSETVANPYRYAGYRWDSDTGLYYLRARYYAPGMGRFLTRDLDTGNQLAPLTQNPYLYVVDNPVNFIDPDGNAHLTPGGTDQYVGFDGRRIWWYDRHFSKGQWEEWAYGSEPENAKEWLRAQAGKVFINVFPKSMSKRKSWHRHIDTSIEVSALRTSLGPIGQATIVDWDAWLFTEGTYDLPKRVEKYEERLAR